MSSSSSARPRRVVCVDDEPRILASLQRLAREETYEVLVTEDPEKALEWLRSWDIGVLLVDYRMPTMSGTTLLAKARTVSPSTARILITAFAGTRDVLEARHAGLCTLFPKPWDDRELKRKIRDHLRDRELEGSFFQLKRPWIPPLPALPYSD